MTRPRPIDWRLIKDTLRSWFADATAIETIWGAQSAPQPAYPYASIQVISGGPNALGARDREQWRADGTVEWIGQRELVLSCQTHVGGSTEETHDPDTEARNLMDGVISSVMVPDVIEGFKVAGLALRDRTQPQSIPELVGTEWISRVQAEFRFGFVSRINAETTPGLDAIGYFDKVEVSSDWTGLQSPTSGLNLDDELFDPNA